MALELNGSYLGSRYLSISLAKGESKARRADNEEVPDSCRTVFISNLPYDIKEEEVGDKFRSCGKIKGIRFVHNYSQGHFKG